MCSVPENFQGLETWFARTSKGWKFFILGALLAGSTQAESPWREPLFFSITTNVATNESVFVLGDHPDLGAWDPVKAVQLSYSTGDVWSGQIAVRSGEAVEYRFISRLDDQSLYCAATNFQWLGDSNLSTSTPPQETAPYSGKTLFYLSSWTSVTVQFSTEGTNVLSASLAQVGEGRVPGEYLYRVDGIGEEGDPIQFSFSGYLSETQYWDRAPYSGYGSNDYYTPLDVLVVQDGDVFNYTPPPAPAASAVVTQTVVSTVSNIPNHRTRIYLPRGYADNTWKRYPVLYMHDGQYVANQWGAWPTLDQEISQGRMRETIVVAVEAVNRCAELLPPGETLPPNVGCGTNAIDGIGDAYGDYLIKDVKAFVDANYRTLTNRENTLVAGSSLGGLISCWLGMMTNVFGKVGALSPSFWAGPSLVDWIDTNDSSGLRIYLDLGTNEDSENVMWGGFWYTRYKLLDDGYAENRDLLTVIGCGASHNEAAWKARLPGVLRFLLNPWDEPNRLAQQTYPPALAWAEEFATEPTSLVHRTQAGFRYQLEVATNAQEGIWSPVATSAVEALPWASAAWSLTNAPQPDSLEFYRIVAMPDH